MESNRKRAEKAEAFTALLWFFFLRDKVGVRYFFTMPYPKSSHRSKEFCRRL